MSVPSFTQSVPAGGYRWWYIDAVSDDDQHALTVIVFIGSVFSPYYARARKRGPADAHQYCAVNVALYGSPQRWCMTERSSASVRACKESLSIGQSEIRIQSGRLTVDIDEIAVPLPRRVQGSLTVELPGFDLAAHALTATPESQSPAVDTSTEIQHFWQPIAPQTRIKVDMRKPDLHWQGSAYVDSNHGNGPLEQSFRSWVWSRSHEPDNATTILYDVLHRDGQQSQRSLRFSKNGTLSQGEAPRTHQLKATRYWRIPRTARTAQGASVTQLQTLEDTPFYSRSRFREECGQIAHTTVHESLYLDRFDTFWVRSLLPFRMPRSTRPVLIR